MIELTIANLCIIDILKVWKQNVNGKMKHKKQFCTMERLSYCRFIRRAGFLQVHHVESSGTHIYLINGSDLSTFIVFRFTTLRGSSLRFTSVHFDFTSLQVATV